MNEEKIISHAHWGLRFTVYAAILMNLSRAAAGYSEHGFFNMHTMAGFIMAFTMVLVLYLHESSYKRHNEWRNAHDKLTAKIDSNRRADNEFAEFQRYRTEFLQWRERKC